MPKPSSTGSELIVNNDMRMLKTQLAKKFTSQRTNKNEDNTEKNTFKNKRKEHLNQLPGFMNRGNYKAPEDEQFLPPNIENASD